MNIRKNSRRLAFMLALVMLVLQMPLTVTAHSGGNVISFDALHEEELYRAYDFGTYDFEFPAFLHAVNGYGERVFFEGLEWESYPEFDPLVSEFYSFTPVLPEGYVAVYGTLPLLSIFIRPEGDFIAPVPLAVTGPPVALRAIPQIMSRGHSYSITADIIHSPPITNGTIIWEVIGNLSAATQFSPIHQTFFTSTTTHSAVSTLHIASNETAHSLIVLARVWDGNNVYVGTTTYMGTNITAHQTHSHTLTLRAAGSGGSVAIGSGSFGATRTAEFTAGTQVTISARADRGFHFDRWRYSYGSSVNRYREYTTFTMPNRSVTVWADFDDDWYWRGPPVPPLPPGAAPYLAPPGAAPVPAVPPPVALNPQPETPARSPQPLPEADPVEPAPATTPLTVNLNGRRLSFADQGAITLNGVALIPVSELFQALGYRVEWDSEARTATMRRQNITMVITEGERGFSVNGINRNLRAPAIMVNGRLMVPFVEVIESIGGRSHRDLNDVIHIYITR